MSRTGVRSLQFAGTTEASLVRVSSSAVDDAARFFARCATRRRSARTIVVEWSTIVAMVEAFDARAEVN